MGDLISDGAAWLKDTLQSDVSQSVVYWRGVNSVTVTATVGQSVVEALEEDGRVLRVESRDFLIPRTDLIISGVEVEPDRGDKIRWVVGSDTFVFEVMALPGEGHWRDSDPYRMTLRVHAKRVAVE